MFPTAWIRTLLVESQAALRREDFTASTRRSGVALGLTFGLLLGGATCSQADTDDASEAPFLSQVRELLAEDTAAGSTETAAAVVDGLQSGAVEDPVLAEELAGAVREALRPLRLRVPQAETLTQTLAGPIRVNAPVVRETPSEFRFPRDEGAHSLLSEWWYWNGHLQTASGRRFGFQLCFFRTRVGIHFLHMAVTDEQNEKFVYSRTFHRPKNAKSSHERLDMAYGDTTAKGFGVDRQGLHFKVGDYGVALALKPSRAPMNVNGNGVIDMPEGTTSRYYSRTRMGTTGKITLGGETFDVTGSTWFDHQWGNFVSMLRPWDWFCVQMDDGTAYNLFSFRRKFGIGQIAYVNVLRPDGELETSRKLDIGRTRWWKSPHTRKHYVTDWNLKIPARNETLQVTATLEDQEMPRVGIRDFPPTYWEGSMTVRREKADGSVDFGRSYSEHFPYRKPWN